MQRKTLLPCAIAFGISAMDHWCSHKSGREKRRGGGQLPPVTFRAPYGQYFRARARSSRRCVPPEPRTVVVLRR